MSHITDLQGVNVSVDRSALREIHAIATKAMNPAVEFQADLAKMQAKAYEARGAALERIANWAAAILNPRSS